MIRKLEINLKESALVCFRHNVTPGCIPKKRLLIYACQALGFLNTGKSSLYIVDRSGAKRMKILKVTKHTSQVDEVSSRGYDYGRQQFVSCSKAHEPLLIPWFI